MALNCPNKSWPAYKEMVAKHGEDLAYDAFRFNGYKMFNSVQEAELLIAKKKTFDTKYTSDIKKRLIEVLKFQISKYEGRPSAASREYVQNIESIIEEIQSNNDLVGIMRLLELSSAKSDAVFQRITDIQQQYPNGFDNLTQEEVARVAETLQEIRVFMSTYDIIDEIETVLPASSPAMQVLSNLRMNRKNIIRKYKDMHEEVLASWLSSQVERVNKALSADDHKKYYLTKTRIKELLNSATADISVFNKMLGTQANSSDPLTGLIAARIKEESFNVHQDNVETADRVITAYKATGGSNNPDEFNKKYLRKAKNFEFVHEMKDGQYVYDKDGKAVGEWKYVERTAMITEFNEDEYSKDLKEFKKSLPPGADEAGIQRRLKMIRDWRKANTQLRQDPTSLIDQRRRELTPLEFDRWFSENTVRVEVKHYSNGSTNMDYHDPATIHSTSKDGKSFIIYRDISEFYRPADKYRNKDFARLMATDPYFKEIHDAYQAANQRVHPLKRLKYGIIPQKRKKGYDKYITGNGETVWTNIRDDFRHSTNVETYDTVYGLQSPEGKDLNNIPIYFTELLDEKELSTDLLESVLDYYQMANNYNSMSKIEPFVEMVYDAIRGNDVVNISPRDVNTLTPKGEVKRDKRTGRPLKSKTQNVNEALIEFLDKVVYGEYEIPSIMEVNGKEISKNKIAGNVLKLTSLNGLAFNVNSFFNNTLIGNFTMAIEAAAGKYFGFKEFTNAESTFFSHLPSVLNDVAKGYPTSKLGKLMIKYDAIQGEFEDEMGNNISGNAAKRAFSMNALFFLTQGAEYQIQGTGLIAMMKKQKVKTKSGAEISLWDAYDEKGNLKPDVLWTKQDQFHFMQRLHSLNKSMHGVYNKFDSPTLQRRWYGKLALLFRKWIYSGFQRRWNSEFHNMESGDVEQGYYNLFFKKLLNDIKSGRLDILTGANLSPRQREARAKTMAEVLVMVSAWLLYAGLKGDDDDEPNSWLQDQVILQSRRLAGDFMFFTPVNPMEQWRVLSNPTVAMSYVEKLSRFMTQLIFNPFEKYERKTSGYEKGDYKLEKRFEDVMPLYNQIMNALYPEDQLGVYKKTGG